MLAYITALGVELPGEAITNDKMEEFLGLIYGKPSRLGKLALRQNKIVKRHYALRPDGSSDWSVSKLIASALRKTLKASTVLPAEVSFLATATTQNDYLVPGSASLVHGELQWPPLEVASFQSVCGSSLMALSMAHLKVSSGEHAVATVGAGEFASRFFRPGFYERSAWAPTPEDTVPLEAEFLRWTLSDGAAGVLIQNQPNAKVHSFRIDWIKQQSFANAFLPCMMAGGKQDPIHSWAQHESLSAAVALGSFTLWQDFKLLDRLLPVWVQAYVRLVQEGFFSAESVDWFLCHYSSHALRLSLVKLLEATGCMIPEERWFNNMATCGNTGSATFFVMLEALLNSGKLRKGQRILGIVPESGRAVIGFVHLTVV